MASRRCSILRPFLRGSLLSLLVKWRARRLAIWRKEIELKICSNVFTSGLMNSANMITLVGISKTNCIVAHCLCSSIWWSHFLVSPVQMQPSTRVRRMIRQMLILCDRLQPSTVITESLWWILYICQTLRGHTCPSYGTIPSNIDFRECFQSN